MQDFLSLHLKTKTRKKPVSFNFRGTEKLYDGLRAVGCAVSCWQGWAGARTSRVPRPVGILLIFALLLDPAESGPRAKLLIASGEWATFLHLLFQSLQPITSYQDDTKKQFLEKCLMRGTNEALFFPFFLHMLQSVCAPCWHCSSSCFCALQALLVVIFLLSCFSILLVKIQTEWRNPSPCLFFLPTPPPLLFFFLTKCTVVPQS